MIFRANILKSKGVTAFLLCLCLALVAANLQVAPIESVSPIASETEGNEEEAVLSLRISDALQTAVEINLDFHSILLDIVQIGSNDVEHGLIDQFHSGQSKAFRVLLRRIISPNAP